MFWLPVNDRFVTGLAAALAVLDQIELLMIWIGLGLLCCDDCVWNRLCWDFDGFAAVVLVLCFHVAVLFGFVSVCL